MNLDRMNDPVLRRGRKLWRDAAMQYERERIDRKLKEAEAYLDYGEKMRELIIKLLAPKQRRE